ncbi:MarR family EPS-associated transcriptional regulator [Herbaspirillum lusitanum]|uniref:MarR family EPS-associated transcriptional regulator n=2 Tax=Herbaspirillum lusitanum TaxID=213312 RepID=A0ABW9A8R8_9BURK
MSDRRDRVKQDICLRIMKNLQDSPEINQRDLAKKLDVSLGSVNYCLKSLVEKGHVKIQNFKGSKNKLGYVYLLTPAGIAEKAILTASFLRLKLLEYELLKEEIALLKKEVRKNQVAHQLDDN